MKCLSIHLTDLCNSECTFCVVGSPFYTTDSVKYEDVERFLEANAEGGYTVVNLHGGEPTIHPRFTELLATIKRLGYAHIHVQTNGIRLASKAFATEVVELGVSKCIVSLHGATAETHEAQTFSKGGFAKTLQGIKNVVERGVPVRTNTVVTNRNLSEMASIVELACDTGVGHVNISAIHPVSSARIARAVAMPKYETARPYVSEAVAAARRRSVRVTLEGFPHCSMVGPEHERLHLFDEYRDIKLLVRGTVQQNYDDWMRSRMRVCGPPCKTCTVRDVCGGVYREYVELYGWQEFYPLELTGADLGLHEAIEH